LYVSRLWVVGKFKKLKNAKREPEKDLEDESPREFKKAKREPRRTKMARKRTPTTAGGPPPSRADYTPPR
jgi:hypothetical protein